MIMICSRIGCVLMQAIFEIGRRYKVMNPDKMRSEYGKLMYMLMDSSEPAIQVCGVMYPYTLLHSAH